MPSFLTIHSAWPSVRVYYIIQLFYFFFYKEVNDEATLTIEHKTEISHNNFMQIKTNNLVNTQADKALGNKKRKKNVKINL